MGPGMPLTDALRFYAATDVGQSARAQRGQLPRRQEARRSSSWPTAWAGTPRARSRAPSPCAPSTRRSSARRSCSRTTRPRRTGASKVTTKDVVALLEHAVQRACAKIHEEARADAAKRGMGTTLSALLIVGSAGLHRPRRRQPHLPVPRRQGPAGHRGPHRLQRAHQAREAHPRADREGRSRRTPSPAPSASTSASRSTRW